MVIYDANNGTKERRRKIAEKFVAAGIHVIMLGPVVNAELYTLIEARTESICDDEEMILANIRSVKISSPDVRNTHALYHCD